VKKLFDLEKHFLVVGYLTLILVGCAGQVPPSGGPIDKSPPKIIYSFPAQRQLNFDSRRIVLRFDKYMSEQDVDNAIYFPPYNLKEMELDWSGKDLTITLHKPLDKNRTYILTVGADAKDLRGNNFAGAINIVFSTGAVIDTGTISGKVFSDKLQPYTIAAYPITQDIDTLDPSRNLPKYVTQSDDSGHYVMEGLANGKYRLICFDDQLRTFTYAPQIDGYASSTRDIEISDANLNVNEVNFIPSIEDTSSPQLYDVALTKSGSLLLKFSKPIEPSTILSTRFVVKDSLTNVFYPVTYAVRLEQNNLDVLLYTSESLPLGRRYLIEVSDSVTDLHKNHVSQQNNPMTVEIDSATTDVPIYYFNFSDSLQNITIYDTLFCQVLMSTAMRDSSRLKVSLLDSTGAEVDDAIFRDRDGIFGVALPRLKSLSWYGLRVRFATSDGRDSVVVRHFRMVDFLSLGDIEGEVSPRVAGRNLVVVAVRRGDGKRFYSVADSSGKFKIVGVPSGEYTVESYVKTDHTMAYYSGKSYPYQFAAPFGFYSGIVKVRARWTTEGIEIKLH
jgi:hypothetical protein